LPYDRDMRGRGVQLNKCRVIIVWMMMVALFVSTLFAPGTMPAAGGGLAFELCTPEGVKLVTLGRDGVPVEVPAGTDHGGLADCPWAQAHAPVLALAADWTPQPPVTLTAVPVLPDVLAVLTQDDPKFTQSQGPPLPL
jgi:hypothetical protein